MELDNNEKAVLEKIKSLSKGGAPIELALRDLKIEIPRRRWIMNVSTKIASHTAVRDILRRLQSKGVITLDYSGENKPKTRIIINDQNYGDLATTEERN